MILGCIQVNVNQNTIKTLKGENGQLTWTFTEKNGEQFYSGQINFVRQGETSSIDVATNNKRDVPFKMFEAYRQRGWTASFSTGSVVLSAKDVQPSDDGTYTLTLAYTEASGNIVSSRGAMRLKVLGKYLFLMLTT